MFTSSSDASWHTDYRDTAWLYIGGFPYDLTEGDILTVFSQFGEPVSINLIRDKETGKSKGFAFLKYEDQRSTDLAVDNLGGATVGGRILKVDHTRYKRKEDEDEKDLEMERALRAGDKVQKNGHDASESEEEEKKRPMLREEIELQRLMAEHDEDDPMKEYLVQEKREEVAAALSALQKTEHKSRNKDRHHRHHHGHRSRNGDIRDRGDDRRRKHRSGRPRSKSR